jgi:hypothetical protein
MAKLTIGRASRADLDLMVEWAAAEGWNPGLADADCFHRADPNGFLIGRVGGEPVACISVVRYGERFGFLGFYICRPDARGRGYGWAIWQEGMRYLDGCVVGLDGVLAQEGNYRKSGFVLAHRNVRHGGEVRPTGRSNSRVAPVAGGLIERTGDYDGTFFPASRERFLRCWLHPDRRIALAFLEDGAVQGYGVIRACLKGHKIGPLFAEDDAIADILFLALIDAAAAQEVYLDVPEPNAAAAALAARHGLSPVFETARMYRGDPPRLPLGRIFGITTFELG